MRSSDVNWEVSAQCRRVGWLLGASLQAAVLTPATGYDIHHIVEQTPAEQDGFPRARVDSHENLARIPTLKHWQITGWFATRGKEFGGLSPRQYLQGKDWAERARVGIKALVDHGVLMP